MRAQISVFFFIVSFLSNAYAASPDSYKRFGSPAYVSFIGGTGIDSVESATFDSSNNLWILGSTSTFDGASLSNPTNPSNGAAGSGGFVMKFNPQWQRQLFFQACPGRRIAIPPDGTIWLACSPNIMHLDATGATVLGNFTGFSNNTRDIVWVASDANPSVYDLVVLDPGPFFTALDSISRLPGASGSTQRLWTTPTGSGTAAMTIDRNTNMIYVGGEQTTNTTLETYRSAFLYRYCLSGVRDQSWRWWAWDGPAVRGRCTTITPTCPDLPSDPGLTNHTYLAGLVYSGSNMYVMGASDGVDNIFKKQPNRLDQDQPAVNGACYSTPCYGYPSARRNSFFARAKTDYSNLDRQTYMVPYLLRSAIGLNSTYLRNYPVCQCYDINETMATRGPNSFNAFGAAEFTDGGVQYVITWGGASFRGPETPTNAWHFNAGYARQNAHISILDYQMADIMMATLIQAATAPRDYAFRDGLLVIVGNLLGSELSTTGNNDLKGVPYQWELPVTGNAVQSTFGGGGQDGFIYVRCVKDVDACGVLTQDWVSISPQPAPIVCSAPAAVPSSLGSSPTASGTSPVAGGSSPVASGSPTSGAGGAPVAGASPPSSNRASDSSRLIFAFSSLLITILVTLLL